MTATQSKSLTLKGRVIGWLVRLLHWLPSWLVTPTGRLMAYSGRVSRNKSTRTTETNLAHCFTELDASQRSKIALAASHNNVRLSKEFALAWLGNRAQIEGKIGLVQGENLIQETRQQDQPLIIAVPHIGNWEFFWHWLQLNYTAISMYTPSEEPALDAIMLAARTRFGGQPFATDPQGIMKMMRSLKKGGVMMILPDQVPKHGAGTYSPFFGQPAYTMTLLHKFVQKTGAQLLFGSCLYNRSSGQLDINLEKPNFDTQVEQAEVFNTKMNAQLEHIIRRNPGQYQWNYKRFKKQAAGGDFYRQKEAEKKSAS